MTPYQAGHLAGSEADAPMDDFEMSRCHDDFVIGYIVGHSEMESFRAASPLVAAMTAGEMGYQYNVSYNSLLPYLRFDAELSERLRDAYTDAAESAAEDRCREDDEDEDNDNA